MHDTIKSGRGGIVRRDHREDCGQLSMSYSVHHLDIECITYAAVMA